jgi:hypothetical protein
MINPSLASIKSLYVCNLCENKFKPKKKITIGLI